MCEFYGNEVEVWLFCVRVQWFPVQCSEHIQFGDAQKWLCSILQEYTCGTHIVCVFSVYSDVAFVSIKDGWIDFSFFQPCDLHLPLPRIRNAFHLKSHMAWYICTSSLVYFPFPLPWASQAFLCWYSTSSSHKGSRRNQTFSFGFSFLEMSYSSVAYWVLL